MKRISNGGSTVSVPENVHRAGPTFGGRNTRAQVDSDSRDLAGAAGRDADAMVENARRVAPEHTRSLEDASQRIKKTTNDEFDNWLLRQLDDD